MPQFIRHVSGDNAARSDIGFLPGIDCFAASTSRLAISKASARLVPIPDSSAPS